MNNQFNLNRFARVFRKHTAEHIRWYLIATAVLTGGLTLIFGFLAYMENQPINEKIQGVIFIFGLLGSGSVFTSTVFAHLGDKRTAIAALIIPASHFEKYLVGWMYSLLIFLPVYIASFYLVVTVILNLDHSGADPVRIVNVFARENQLYFAFLFYALIHGVSIWGSVFFEKLHFIKTAFAFITVFLLVIFVNFHWLEVLFDKDLGTTIPFSNVGFQDKNNFYMVKLPTSERSIFGLLPVVLAFILWLAAYFRLTEKQI